MKHKTVSKKHKSMPANSMKILVEIKKQGLANPQDLRDSFDDINDKDYTYALRKLRDMNVIRSIPKLARGEGIDMRRVFYKVVEAKEIESDLFDENLYKKIIKLMT